MLSRVGAKAVTALAVAGIAVAISSTASAHIGVSADEVAAGASTSLTFRYSHGCGESPTNSLRFEIPEGINNAIPYNHPGWDITVENVELAEPITSGHGEEVTERPAVITFTARDGFEVPAHGIRDEVTIGFTAPEELGQLFFKVIQGCLEGSNDWIEEWDGAGTEPEHPAPSVMVVAATGESDDSGHEPDEEASGSSTEASGHDEAPGTTIASGDDDDDGDDDGNSNGLAIVGIVLGALGIGVGGTALATSRKRS